METLLAERDRLLKLLKIRAVQRARVVVVGSRSMLIKERPLAAIQAAVAAYPVGRAEMLLARTIEGDVPSEQLDIALASDFGRGTVLRKARGARRRLAKLLRIGRALAALGGGMRLEEIAAWTALSQYRVRKLLAWAKRERVFFDEGELGWFLNGQTPDKGRRFGA